MIYKHEIHDGKLLFEHALARSLDLSGLAAWPAFRPRPVRLRALAVGRLAKAVTVAVKGDVAGVLPAQFEKITEAEYLAAPA